MSQSWQNSLGLKPATAIVATASALSGLAPHEVVAQQIGQNTSEIIAAGDYGLKYPQNKTAKPDDFKAFDPTETLEGKPYILVEGYNGCPFCNKISVNLGKLRKALDADGKNDVPIVVINVHPEEDAKGVEEYAEAYLKVGALSKMEDFGKKFFIVFPSSREKAVELQERLEASFNREDRNSHGLKIAVVNGDGVCTAAALGTVEGDKSAKLINTITKELGAGRER